MIDALAEAAGQDVPRETFEKVEAFVTMLREENERQNLIAGGRGVGSASAAARR